VTPHHLQATAAAWSLTDARQHLATLADDEAAQIAAEASEEPALLRSTVYGSRHGSGSYSDPTVGMIATADRPPRRNRWAEMSARAERRITGIAAMLRITGVLDPLACIIAALPNTLPGTAAVIAQHLQDEDRWIREAIGIAALRVPILHAPCPACRCRTLHVQAEGPRETWTVVCDGARPPGGGPHRPCLCTGTGCPCRMDGAVEGVAHIWPRAVVLGAVAGAAHASPSN
jgi:hypothetical protein